MTLRLHLNENTSGCSPAVLEALRTMTREDVGSYPDYEAVTAACARYFGVAPEWIVLTNGLDEGLHVIAQAAAARGGQGHARTSAVAIIIEPAFEMYELGAEAAGLGIVKVAFAPDFSFPTEAVLAALTPETRLVYLNDPHNPSGRGIPAGAIDRIATAAPDALVIVDEAYADFSGRTAIGPLLRELANVIVGRTFSKAHGLAGLRAGALVAQPSTLAPIRRILPPYSLNVAAVRALEAAVADRAYLSSFVAQAEASRTLIAEACARWGLQTWPSEANFVLVRVGPEASAIVSALSAHGILIRDRSTQPGCDGCIRLSAGIVLDTRRCLEVLEGLLASRSR